MDAFLSADSGVLYKRKPVVPKLTQGEAITVVGRMIHCKVLPSGWGVGRINTDEHGD